jgi:exodeoxyribonuclease III
MTLKIMSWNVNSIRKGVYDTLFKLTEDQKLDIICFQETKCTEYDGEQFFGNSVLKEIYPYRYWNDSVGGQAGVSIWTKIKPLNITKEIPRIYQLKEGRIIILEFENMILLNTYVPNTGRGDIAEDHRNVWHNALITWLTDQFAKDKMLIWCGDLNVVSEPALDTTHHKIRPKNPCAGLKEFEYLHFNEYLELGLCDAFRTLYPDTISYTWYSARNPEVAWRLDYFMVKDVDMSKIKDVIHYKRLPSTISDHVPIILILN